MMVDFSMDPRWFPLMEARDKVATTRTKRKCDVGDTFMANGRRYVITRIVPMPMWSAVNCYFGYEGFRTAQEFTEALRSYYPDIQDDTRVWTHFFVEVVE